MGDAENEVEEEILKSGADVRTDVLKVSHHGSSNSSGDEFLKAVLPRFAAIEVGKDNGFGHPTLRTLKKLERAGVKIIRTDQSGTIKLESNGENIGIIGD